MQCFSEEFLGTVKGLFESDLNLLATIVYEDEPWSIEFKRNSNMVLVEVTKENRNKLSEILLLIFSNNKVFDKLNKYQKIKVYEILRKYFKEDKFIQIFKLFNNAIHYVAEKRIIELEEKKRFKVKGRSKEHKVIFDVKNGCFNCDCDLFIGKGKYKGSRGECSHIQAVQIF